MARRAQIAAKFAAGAFVAGIAAAPLPAAAGTIPFLDNYVGPIAIKFMSFESFTATPLAPGVQNFGVFTVSTINAGADFGTIKTGQPIWTAGTTSVPQIAGIFDDITVSSVTPTSPTSDIIQNTGGQFELFGVPVFPSFSQGLSGYTTGGCTGVNTLCYNTVSNQSGATTPILTMDLIPGADTTDPTATLVATTNGTTVPVSGSATGFFDITGGSDAGQFGKGGFSTATHGPADMTIIDDFCANAANCAGAVGPIGDWEQLDDDPVGANAVPEPASLALLGTALLGFGFFRRRRHGGREQE